MDRVLTMKRLLAGLLLLVSCASFAQVFNGAQYYAPLNFGQQSGSITLDLSKSGAFQVTAIGNISINGPVGYPTNASTSFALAITQGPNGGYVPVFGPSFVVPSRLTFSTIPGATDVLVFSLNNGIAVLVSSSLSASGAGVPGGTNGQYQYNNNGVFGGVSTIPDTNISLSTPLQGQTYQNGLNAVLSGALLTVTCNTYQINCTGSAGALNIGATDATTTVSSASPIVLTSSSKGYQIVTGSTAQTFTLPDATTLQRGFWYFDNNSSATVTINNNGGSSQGTVPAGGFSVAELLDNSTANGTWTLHPWFPSTISIGSGTTGLQMNNALNTTPQISAGASSNTSPAFIPYRSSATWGWSGDATHLYGVCNGASCLTATANNVTVPALTMTAGLIDASASFTNITTNTTLGDNWHQYDTNSATQAAITLTFSPSPTVGEIVCFIMGGASGVITTLTMAANTGQNLGPNQPTTAAIGASYCWQYRSANTTWYRIQ